MQIHPDETQVMLQASVRRFVAKDCPAPEAKAPLHDEGLWSTICEQGWLAAGVDEATGGLGGSIFDTCLIAEELGRGLVREAYVPFAATATLLAALAPEHELLAGLLWGPVLPLLAHAELAQRGRSERVATTARQTEAGFVLSGEKSAVLGGPAASHFLITAVVEGDTGPSAFVVENGRPGLDKTDFRTIDSRGASNLAFERLELDKTALLGTRGGAGQAISRAMQVMLIAGCSEALGAMGAALDLTRGYLPTRQQFGRPIAEFQALQHRLADMFIESEMSRSIVLRAIDSVRDGDLHQAEAMASACKARTGKAAQFVGANTVQLHGGIGITDEYAASHYFRRLAAFDLVNGPGASHLEQFAERALGLMV